MVTGIQLDVLFDLPIVLFFAFQLQTGCLVVEGVRRIGVQEELREECVEDVQDVVHGRPCLVYHVQAHAP